MQKSGPSVRLDREPKIRCLHKVRWCDTRNLLGHRDHIRPSPDMLDDRIRVNDVKLIVTELGHISSVPRYG